MFLAPEIPATYERRPMMDGEAGIFETLALMRRMIESVSKMPASPSLMAARS